MTTVALPDSKVVLVTGASSGFGRATASLLSKKGFTVFGTSRNPKARIEEGFGMLQLDLDSAESAKACVSALMERTGRLDILVNNAGYAFTGGAEEASIEEIRAHFETNFFGVVRLTKEVLPGMRKRRSGQVINIGSLAGTIPVPFEGFYAAAKAALLAYTEALRHEVKNLGIKVSIVEPGFFKTGLSSSRRATTEPIDDYSQAREKAISKLVEDFEKGSDPALV